MEEIEEIERKIKHCEYRMENYGKELEIVDHYLSTLTKDDADYEKAKEEEDFYKSAIKDYWYDLKKLRSYLKKLKGEN